jgi:hypothetical protein
MKNDKFKQYVTLRESLLKENAALEARLTQINKALGSENSAAKAGQKAAPAARAPQRIDNPMSLKEAVRKVTSVRPLTKKEILEGIKKIGYRFAAKDPMNSLNVILYSKGQFKNEDGKFSPAK